MQARQKKKTVKGGNSALNSGKTQQTLEDRVGVLEKEVVDLKIDLKLLSDNVHRYFSMLSKSSIMPEIIQNRDNEKKEGGKAKAPINSKNKTIEKKIKN